jgi:prolyl oligopeptidase
MKPSIWIVAAAATLAVMAGVAAKGADSVSDPYVWLEDVHGTKQLAWVAEQNTRTKAVIQADPRYAADHEAILKVLDATDRIPLGGIDHEYVFNFWQDAANPKGVWRRTTIADYANRNPHWETLIDVDKLAADEHENWIWKGANCSNSLAHCLVLLSRDGGDAHVVREFDLKTKAFLRDGFTLVHAKSGARYLGEDAVLFETDFGPDTMTTSGYPRIVKLWQRGTPIDAAKTVYEGKREDVDSQGSVSNGPYGSYALVVRSTSFFETEYFHVRKDGDVRKLPLPHSAVFQGVVGEHAIVTLRKAWTIGVRNFAQGALLALDLKTLDGPESGLRIDVLYVPGPRSSIDQVSTGRDAVYASIYDNVTGSIHAFRFKSGQWSDTKLTLPANGSTSIVSTNDWGSEAMFTFESYLKPTTLYSDKGDDKPVAIKALPERFDAQNLVTEQFEVASKDGVQIPYFVTRPKTASGPIATILYGYGGFEIALTPGYSANFGMLWLTRGGGYVVANIRGGGEFGPAWHDAALLSNRQRAYDDFAAVAADLVKRGVTTPKKLGIMGGSNGGLLVSTVMSQHPELFGAVVCQVPLIDMLRYTQIGAGASWAAEYGDPADPKAREWISKYSPYQNVRPSVNYPPILFTTATSDDRVTPVHARKMAAKMEAMGGDILYFENTDGGHSAGANHKQAAEMWALSFIYLKQKLGLK